MEKAFTVHAPGSGFQDTNGVSWQFSLLAKRSTSGDGSKLFEHSVNHSFSIVPKIPAMKRQFLSFG